ncbi:unnamed protein product [Debaryomyces tyrocola]|nr:unnamed protein product [Debaryomyces tyrocola]
MQAATSIQAREK